MIQRSYVFILNLFLFSVSFLPIVPSFGADTATYPVAGPSFNGIWTSLSDGRVQLSMRDGSLIYLGPGFTVDPQRIGKSKSPTLRTDYKGRIMFAADPQLDLIYTFTYKRDNSWIMMTDPEDMVSGFRFDPNTGQLKEILLPTGERVPLP